MKAKSIACLIFLGVVALGFQNCAKELDPAYLTNKAPGSKSESGSSDGSSTGSLVIVSQSSSSSFPLGSNVNLTVVASGSDNIVYQWYKDGVALDGATSETLTLTNLAAADGGKYYAIATDANGLLGSQRSLDIHLTVTIDPKIRQFINPSYNIGGIAHVIYSYTGQSQADRARWQLLYCRALMDNPAATVVSATLGTEQQVFGDAYPTENAISCPNDIIINDKLLIDFTYVGNGVCARTWVTAPELRIPYTEITCRIP